MLHALRGRIGIVAYRSIHAFHFVGGNTRADTRTANYDAALGLAILNRATNFFSKVRKVYRLCAIRAHINRLVASLSNGLKHSLFQRETPVVKSDGNFHFFFLTDFFVLTVLAIFIFGSKGLACAKIFSTVKPSFSKIVLYGADAPKRSIAMTLPVDPTYLSQPRLAPASTAILAEIFFGNTDSR